MKLQTKYLLIFVIFIFSITKAGTTGKIVGEIFDSEFGQPLIGANILVEGTYFGAAADLDGYFMIPIFHPETTI